MKSSRKNGVQFFILISIMAFLFSACSKKETKVVTDNLPEISNYPIVGTNQSLFFDTTGVITEQKAGDAFYGQNANYPGTTPSYTDNGDGTITDNVTGLMWSKTIDLNGDGTINVDDKLTYEEALAKAQDLNLGEHSDWRLPTIKELYSLIIYSGKDPSGYMESSTAGLSPFIDTNYFEFAYGDEQAGERLIDAQYLSSTKYVSTTMNGDETVFGVNFADGRIKGYGMQMPWGEKTFYVAFVRGNSNYGKNEFVDNGDSTISDKATGLMWMQFDSKKGMTWQEALNYAENFEYAGYSDWRLPSIKELQSIVDYTRSPNTTNSPAIDELFDCSQITNEVGQPDYPFYWSSTTHENYTTDHSGGFACYVSFGRAMGYMQTNWMDVHGAGAQRSDPKSGNPEDYATGNGPQGDAIRILNYVRLVRDIK